jgi:hypothetical protein
MRSKERLSPRELRKAMNRGFKEALDQYAYFLEQYEWAYRLEYGPTSGDDVKVRSHGTSPTESVALHGYGPAREKHEHDPSQGDRIVRGQAALRRHVDKAFEQATKALVELQNALDGESKKLEKAMGHLKPGPSARNPRFEVSVKGDMKLPRDVLRDLEAAQTRREERGEAFGG